MACLGADKLVGTNQKNAVLRFESFKILSFLMCVHIREFKRSLYWQIKLTIRLWIASFFPIPNLHLFSIKETKQHFGCSILNLLLTNNFSEGMQTLPTAR